METTANDLARVVTAEAAHELNVASDKVKHCLGQLSDEQIWWRPSEAMNAIGNLVLHLSGNLNQWVVAGVGGKPVSRNRPAEFAERGPIPKAELLQRLESAVAATKAAIGSATASDLTAVRHVQGRDVTGAGAIVHAVTHFHGHMQEIIHLTRMQLGDNYRFAWTPATPEEAAAASK